MKKLSAPAYRRARDFIHAQARPLERARFAHEFEGGPRAAVLEALAAFQNPDGGYGRALEPDVRLPASSAIATLTGLDVLRELDAGADEPQLRRALAWVVAQLRRRAAGLALRAAHRSTSSRTRITGAGSCTRRAARGRTSLIPGARLLSHLQHWRALAPATLVASYTDAFRAHVASLDGRGRRRQPLLRLDGRRLRDLRAKLRALALAQREHATRPSGPGT